MDDMMMKLGSNVINAALVGAVLAMAVPGGALELARAQAPAPQAEESPAPARAQTAEPRPAAEPAAEPPRQQQAAPAIRVVAATRRELVEDLTVTGSIVPRDEAVVGTDVQGLIVEALNFDIGDTVRIGEVMAVLDKSALETQLAQTDATLAQTVAAAAQAEAQIGEAEVGVRQAEEQLGRAQTLRERQVATQAQLDEAENALDTAKARVVAAERGLGAAQAQIKVIEAQRENVLLQIAKTEVRSPADGLVLERNATLGGIVSGSGGALFRIAVNGAFELAADVPETVLTRLATGMKAAVTLPGLAEPLRGEVRRISPEINAETRLGSIRITLPASEAARAGSFARGVVEVARREALAVPSSAVLFDGREAFLQIVTEGRVKTAKVALGIRAGDLIEVLSGLGEGQEVVARAGTFVADGDMVTPVRDETVGALAP